MIRADETQERVNTRYWLRTPEGDEYPGSDSFPSLKAYQAALPSGYTAIDRGGADYVSHRTLESGLDQNYAPELNIGGRPMGPIDYFNSLGVEFPSLMSAAAIPAIPAGVSAGLGIANLACSLFPSLCSSAGAAIGGMTSSQGPAPNAGLITGSCPPGLRRRTVAYGRDICVKKPRMNPLNPHALRRAARRMAGFHAFAVKAEKELNKIVRKGGYRAPAKRSGCSTCGKSKCGCR